jgi:DNA-binding CsgD family transcriptional regulator/MFS family permease
MSSSGYSMQNLVRTIALLALHTLCFSMLEVKDPGILNFSAVYSLVNLLFAFGIVLFGVSYKLFSHKIKRALPFIMVVISVLYLLSCSAALLSADAFYLASVSLSAVISGIIGGAAYYSVYLYIPSRLRGRVVGFGLLYGTLMQYFIEVIRNYNALMFVYFYLAAYILAAAGLFFLLHSLSRGKWGPAVISTGSEFAAQKEPSSIKPLFIVLIITIALLSYMSAIYEGIFQVYDMGIKSNYELLLLKNTRLFYCISLAAAGLLADLKGRPVISGITVSVLVILILDLFLLKYTSIKFLNWIILFLGAGFLTIFVTLSFLDTAERTKNPALWAGGGRLIKHFIMSFGTLSSVILFKGSESVFLIVLAQYLILLVLFIFLMLKLYKADFLSQTELITEPSPSPELPPVKTTYPLLSNFNDEYGLTARENQILSCILSGAQIKDIARECYVTERTVKFHIGNILKKTGAKNQKELISDRLSIYINKQ